MVSSIGGMPSFAPQMLTQMREKMFSKLDADGDGSITKTELEAAPKPEGRKGGKAPDVTRMLEDFDGDGDGAITQSEMTAGFQKIDARMQGQFLQMQEAGGGRGGPGPGKPPSADELFGKLDGDGSITKAELESAKPEQVSDRPPPPDAEKMLADLDGDGDGAISKEEMTSGFEKRAKEREAGGGIERQRQQMLSYFLRMQESRQAA